MIRYYLYQWQAKGNLQGLWFARAASDETLNLEALSEHMHSHNCPYSQGTISVCSATRSSAPRSSCSRARR